MALYNIATDLKTRQTVWISTKPARPQLNSHRSPAMAAAGIDGFCAAELAGLHTDYRQDRQSWN